MKRIALSFIVLTSLLSFCAIPASGWGQKGHRIVAAVAQDHLTATAKKNLAALLGQEKQLSTIANWADTIKSQRPDTKPWHYVDIPGTSSGYDPGRDCTDDRGEATCVVEEIEQFGEVLADKDADRVDRVEALKFLVHFVGDLGCPMHAIKDERGGNGVHVVFLGDQQCARSGCNLHSVFDSALLEHARLTQKEYVAHLEKLIKDKKLKARGTPKEWANESWKLAKAAWVSDGSELDQPYYDKEIEVVDAQMAVAGLRLAKLLNKALR